MTKHATPYVPVRKLGTLIIRFLLIVLPFLGFSSASAQVFSESASIPDNNDNAATAENLPLPALISGISNLSDADWWNIPNGTDGVFQVQDLFDLNGLLGGFLGVTVELLEFSDQGRSSLVSSTILEEGDSFTIFGSSYYSVRILGNSDASVPSGLINGLIFLLDDILGFDNLANIVENFLDTNPIIPLELYTILFVQTAASSGGSVAAPVVWVDFSAEISGAGVELSWTTASEENNAGFSIEYSPDAENWESLDFVAGMGSTTEMTAYTYLHSTPALGYNYYRLKQTDFNGDFEYSPIREVVQQGAVTTSAFNVFPNPTVDVLNVSPLIGSITLRDLQGRTLHQSQAGGSWTQLDISSYPSGIYILQLQTNEGILQSFNIQKN